MNEENNFTEQESLDLISSMIRQAKSAISDDGIYYLIWGWAVFIATIANWILIKTHYENYWIPWVILMPLTGIVVGVIGARRKRTARVKTFVNEFMGYLWTSFGISLFMVILFQFKLGIENTYSVILILYGIGTFVSGGVLRFLPLKIGGIVCWTIAI